MLEEILLKDNVVKSINDNLDKLIILIPEIKDMIGFEHKSKHHYLDVWEHTLKALSYSSNNFVVRLTLLFHDIGKPHSYQEDGKFRHFKNHNILSEKIAKKRLTELDYDKCILDKICYLVLNHDIEITKEELKNDYELQLLRFEVQICDIKAHRIVENDKKLTYEEDIKKLIKEYKN